LPSQRMPSISSSNNNVLLNSQQTPKASVSVANNSSSSSSSCNGKVSGIAVAGSPTASTSRGSGLRGSSVGRA
jgi:hypothetical protein